MPSTVKSFRIIQNRIYAPGTPQHTHNVHTRTQCKNMSRKKNPTENTIKITTTIQTNISHENGLIWRKSNLNECTITIISVCTIGFAFFSFFVFFFLYFPPADRDFYFRFFSHLSVVFAVNARIWLCVATSISIYLLDTDSKSIIHRMEMLHNLNMIFHRIRNSRGGGDGDIMDDSRNRGVGQRDMAYNCWMPRKETDRCLDNHDSL